MKRAGLPSVERLLEIRIDLHLGIPLAADAVADLEDVIVFALAHARGRGRPAGPLQVRAGVVGVLHERDGLPLSDALYGAWPDAKAHERARLERTYRTMRASKIAHRVPERSVRAARAAIERSETARAARAKVRK